MNKSRFWLFCSSIIFCAMLDAAQSTTIVAPTSEAADGLDLQAVSVLFKESKSIEAFEKALNDPDSEVNNLDLNEDGETDFIRVLEASDAGTRMVILQVPLAEDQFQDVATIEVEKTDTGDYQLQVHGNHIIYGPDYYVVPAHVHVHTWPIITWMYAPAYRPYRSSFYFGFYPVWWRPFAPVSVNVYRTRTLRYTNVTTFSVYRTSRVKSVTRINYKPRNSVLVTRKTRVSPATTVQRTRIKKTTVASPDKATTKSVRKKTVTTRQKSGVKKTRSKKTVKTTQGRVNKNRR